MKKIACCLFSYEITKGMKSYGSLGLLKSAGGKELIYQSIRSLQQATKYKDLYLLLGFDEERIQKKLIEYKINSQHLINDKYDIYNTGYAFKLILNAIMPNIDEIDGVLFANSNTLIKQMPKYYTNKSWVIVQKPRTKKKKTNIGCRENNKQVEYMFYDIGDNVWTELFFLTSKDIKLIYSESSLYNDNMFNFEIINTAIEKQNISFNTIYCNNKDILTITGIKDKNKLR